MNNDAAAMEFQVQLFCGPNREYVTSKAFFPLVKESLI